MNIVQFITLALYVVTTLLVLHMAYMAWREARRIERERHRP